MSKKIRTEAVDYLFEAILSLKDKEECYTFSSLILHEILCSLSTIVTTSKYKLYPTFFLTIHLNSSRSTYPFFFFLNRFNLYIPFE